MDTFSLISAKIGSFFGKFVGKSTIPTDFSGYKVEKDLTPIYSKVRNRVVSCVDEKGGHVILKRVSARFHDLDRVYLKNEATVLKSISNLKTKISPQFVEFREEGNVSALVTQTLYGVKTNELESAERAKIVIDAYHKLFIASRELGNDSSIKIPFRHPLNYFITNEIGTLKMMIKDPANFTTYIKYSLVFFINYFIGLSEPISYRLIHRDLFPDNILYDRNNNDLKILDWESAVISDPIYDIAMISVIYAHEIGVEQLKEILKKYLMTNAQRRRFKALAIMHAIQMKTYTDKDHHVYKEATQNVEIILKQVIPSLMQRKAPFEVINTFTLDLIWRFYRVTGQNIFDKKTKIILCYHSVGADGWRFSTNPDLLEDHLSLLQKYSRVCSLDELLKEASGGVSITFDDGYTNLVDNALPILKNHDVTACIFAIGKAEKANRHQLENNLPIMNVDGLKLLHDSGWEIGFHTDTHVDLGKMNEGELEKEIVSGKAELEKRLGFTMKYFAYPRGIFTKEAIAVIKKAGFTMAFTVDGASAKPAISDPYLIDRVPVEGELTAEQLMALISPLGLKVAHIFLKILQTKESYFPRK